MASPAAPLASWRCLCDEVLRPGLPFEVHREAHAKAFQGWDTAVSGPPPAWVPSPGRMARANVTALAREAGVDGIGALHAWSVGDRARFWHRMVRRLGIRLRQPYDRVVDLSGGIESPRWMCGARLNIAASCFRGDPGRVAILCEREDGAVRRVTLRELRALADRVASGLVRAGFAPGDAIAIDMPMHIEAVAAYLGILLAGCACVSIADSFAPEEIATRLRIAGAKGIFTQDVMVRGGKPLPLYEKVARAGAPRAIVLGGGSLRPGDVRWEVFLAPEGPFEAVDRDPHDAANILFSSGTTGDPKAIPWTHTTPIKCIADAWLHHDIHEDDVLAWPTSLGWMMGPWLVFASLANGAAMALFDGTPAGKPFARFVKDAGVTMLGVVPTLVKTWRNTGALDGADWNAIRTFSSTGECSNSDDMFWLMSRVRGYAPVIEYCGGTEIGGGFLASTVVQPNVPSAFTTPAMGLDLAVLDEAGRPVESGELYVIPPSIGLSTSLLNRDHHEVYYEGTPRGARGEVLRRHGDEFSRMAGGLWRAHGRVDDTMNLGGIKVSSVEIERACNTVEGVRETAAIAYDPPGGGPSELVVFAVPCEGTVLTRDGALAALRKAVRERLNPLFRITDLVIAASLPRTASNKVMRRELRKSYRRV